MSAMNNIRGRQGGKHFSNQVDYAALPGVE